MAGIYIHIPYCKQKCIYCDFYFRTNQSDKSQMIKCIKEELKIRKDYLQENISSIYFGGGTPSILNEKEIIDIINTLYKNYKVDGNVEITLECNPDDLNKHTLKKLNKTKINRLSIGVQSFNDEDLILLKRAHNRKKAISSIKTAQDLGFQNITIDLIYGIPNQDTKKWAKNLEQLTKLNLPHFSAYSLTVEPNTELHHLIKTKKITPTSDELIVEQFNYLINTAEDNNFIHYEISNFSKKGFFSNHNTSYWENKSYLGIGPSAHSFNKISRSFNIASNKKYISGILSNSPYIETEKLTLNQQYNEYILTSLRTISGVDQTYIEEKFGTKKSKYFISQIEKWTAQKKIKLQKGKYLLTNKGKLYADAISSDLFVV